MVRFWVRECRWLTVRFARRTCSRTLLVELRRTVAPIGGFGLRLRGWEREMTERSPDGVDVLAGQWPGPSVVPAETTTEGDDEDLAESLTALSRLSSARLS